MARKSLELLQEAYVREKALLGLSQRLLDLAPGYEAVSLVADMARDGKWHLRMLEDAVPGIDKNRQQQYILRDFNDFFEGANQVLRILKEVLEYIKEFLESGRSHRLLVLVQEIKDDLDLHILKLEALVQFKMKGPKAKIKPLQATVPPVGNIEELLGKYSEKTEILKKLKEKISIPEGAKETEQQEDMPQKVEDVPKEKDTPEDSVIEGPEAEVEQVPPEQQQQQNEALTEDVKDQDSPEQAQDRESSERLEDQPDMDIDSPQSGDEPESMSTGKEAEEAEPPASVQRVPAYRIGASGIGSFTRSSVSELKRKAKTRREIEKGNILYWHFPEK
ncbi:MAG: hypothetical protein H0Z39_07635 [Peptococcaceae bacterium]|nr:hypothetical protein [Peptococcaceae bacterium]